MSEVRFLIDEIIARMKRETDDIRKTVCRRRMGRTNIAASSRESNREKENNPIRMCVLNRQFFVSVESDIEQLLNSNVFDACRDERDPVGAECLRIAIEFFKARLFGM